MFLVSCLLVFSASLMKRKYEENVNEENLNNIKKIKENEAKILLKGKQNIYIKIRF